ncbi:chalcone isomerase family protein [Vibrio ishigakensis]|nr:chalcone isomerase family protein [Vibrio ishigakensis]
MKPRTLLTLALAAMPLGAMAEGSITASSDASQSKWSHHSYQTVAKGTRTTWFVDYYDLEHKRDQQGNHALIMTFLPEKLTKKKVRTAFIEALGKANPSLDTNDLIIRGLIENLSIALSQDDTVTIVERNNKIQIQHNEKVIYQFADAGGQKQALLNIWLGEKPVDDFLVQV